MTPADRLKIARQKAGYSTAAAAARALTLEEATYRHHENGTRSLQYETARRYAKFFKTTTEWLLHGTEKADVDPGPRQSRRVTLLSWVGAGRLGPVSPIDSVESAGELLVERLPPGEWVALQVEGGSMDRIAVAGSTIIVNRKERSPIPGRFYVFVASDGEATFKRYRANPERYVPYSSNPEEEPIYPEFEEERDWQVFGRVHRVLTDI